MKTSCKQKVSTQEDGNRLDTVKREASVTGEGSMKRIPRNGVNMETFNLLYNQSWTDSNTTSKQLK